ESSSQRRTDLSGFEACRGDGWVVICWLLAMPQYAWRSLKEDDARPAQEYHDFMNRSCFALFLLLTSAWLGAVGHPARAAQLVALAPEEELYADIFSDPPSVAAQPGGP